MCEANLYLWKMKTRETARGKVFRCFSGEEERENIFRGALSREVPSLDAQSSFLVFFRAWPEELRQKGRKIRFSYGMP
jgi:hypothetical protein